MKISYVEIKGFKSLNDVKISGVDKINMIYGYNNSGKSNVLRILELIFKRKKNAGIIRSSTSGGEETFEGDEIGNFWDGIIENTPLIFNLQTNAKAIDFTVRIETEKTEIATVLGTSNSLFSDFYYLGNSHSSVQVEIKGIISKLSSDTSQVKLISANVNKKSIYKLNSSAQPIYLDALKTGIPKSPLLDQSFPIFESILNLYNDCVLFLDNDRYFINEKESKTTFEDFNPRTFKSWLYQMYLNPELYPSFKDLIVFIKEFKVTVEASNTSLKNCESGSPMRKMNLGFSKNANDQIDIMFEMDHKRLPLSNFGTGIQQVLYILSKIYSSRSKIILIEELELNLSPRYQQEILKYLRGLITKNKIHQIFFTTHSKYLTFRNDFSIYEVTINELGNSACSKKPALRKGFFSLDDLI
jgi:AAA15 family ATPase/GTPase